jgi:hypothetical protein
MDGYSYAKEDENRKKKRPGNKKDLSEIQSSDVTNLCH